jgi:hypothetical protein
MRLRELITERTEGKLTKRQQMPTRGVHTYSDAEHMNSDYVQYRLMMALACADGTNPIDIDRKSWIGKRKSAHPYSELEAEMLKHAYKAAGASHTDLNKGDMKSKELDTINKTSPVAKPKRNRYGV